jgi:hypothetical protein
MNGWQDIGTAPKDGTWVLVFCAYAIEPKIFICHWGEYEGDPEPGEWIDSADVNMDVDPSHWMPLPLRPVLA